MKLAEQVVDSSYSAVINAPIEKINLPEWAFNLSEKDYQECSPAHVTAAVTTGPDGRRMSINVEVLGGSPMVQHYQEEVSKPDHLVLTSFSDVYTPAGRIVMHVRWELIVKKISDTQTEFTNHVTSHATEDMVNNLEKQGIPFSLFKAQRQPVSTYHNQTETPRFAASIERAALLAGR
ncbi:hypothetical protein [Paraflavitalea sp. CAU 1676]|uniref:hypothetical protein n=1 Tax=Paraflavitalea sp. CAU 1676 TaxID=3032598 RepID=UPI0023DA2D98|nr:hypothetical protein [Paraflavitalea sp. CAU 1676]MDF2193173.1 hypothetical protein [Paraflavitalea sp. CAU 1676]